MMDQFWKSFKDELVLTAAVLALVSAASFVLVNKWHDAELSSKNLDEERFEEILGEIHEVVSESIQTEKQAGATPVPEPTPTPLAPPTPNPDETYVPYGSAFNFQTEEYLFILDHPRLVFGKTPEGSGKKFVVDVLMKNLGEEGSFSNQLKVAIKRDGKTIIESTAMTLTQSLELNPGDEVAFQASVGLLEGTDVSKVMFFPGGGREEATHFFE